MRINFWTARTFVEIQLVKIFLPTCRKMNNWNIACVMMLWLGLFPGRLQSFDAYLELFAKPITFFLWNPFDKEARLFALLIKNTIQICLFFPLFIYFYFYYRTCLSSTPYKHTHEPAPILKLFSNYSQFDQLLRNFIFISSLIMSYFKRMQKKKSSCSFSVLKPLPASVPVTHSIQNPT